METTKKRYVIPSIERTLVELEEGVCQTPASKELEGSVSTDANDPIEVDEYNSIGGDDGKIDISFD